MPPPQEGNLLKDVSQWLELAKPDVDQMNKIDPTSKADATLGRLLKSHTNTGAMLQVTRTKLILYANLLWLTQHSLSFVFSACD